MSELRIESVTAGYDDHLALDGVDLTVPSGRLVALLGPSGCGKSTLLRVVAGLHRPTAGQVRLGDRRLDDTGLQVPAHRRGVTLVPQEGALFPHLDVADNIAFGLRGLPRATARVDRLLDLVGLTGLGSRRVHELSGGQRQRVALARALAPRPALVLLDEPFSSLDARLRDNLRQDVRTLLAAEDATALLVTHDQDEALSIADEVAVMRAGRVLQAGTPSQVYGAPVDAWTARFLGEATLLPAHERGGMGHTVLGPVPVVGGSGELLLLRPEQVEIGDSGAPATVVARTYRGHEWLVELDVAGHRILARHGAEPADTGETVHVRVIAPGRLVTELDF